MRMLHWQEVEKRIKILFEEEGWITSGEINLHHTSCIIKWVYSQLHIVNGSALICFSGVSPFVWFWLNGLRGLSDLTLSCQIMLLKSGKGRHIWDQLFSQKLQHIKIHDVYLHCLASNFNTIILLITNSLSCSIWASTW